VAKSLNRLSARLVSTLATPGRHADGGGLYATVSTDGNRRRWVFLFRWENRRCEMGLGSLDAVPLARAREMAAKCRLDLAEGRNPLDARQTAKAAQQSDVEAQRVNRRRTLTPDRRAMLTPLF